MCFGHFTLFNMGIRHEIFKNQEDKSSAPARAQAMQAWQTFSFGKQGGLKWITRH